MAESAATKGSAGHAACRPGPPHLQILQLGAVIAQVLVALQVSGLEAGVGIRLLLAANRGCQQRRRRGGRIRRQRSCRRAADGCCRGGRRRHAQLRQVLPDLAGLRCTATVIRCTHEAWILRLNKLAAGSGRRGDHRPRSPAGARLQLGASQLSGQVAVAQALQDACA